MAGSLEMGLPGVLSRCRSCEVMKDARRAMKRKERTNDDSKKIRNDGIRKKGGKGKTTTTIKVK